MPIKNFKARDAEENLSSIANEYVYTMILLSDEGETYHRPSAIASRVVFPMSSLDEFTLTYEVCFNIVHIFKNLDNF